MRRFVLTLSCPDRMGIVAAVANFLLDHECNILDSAQFGDAQNQRFFMRVCFASNGALDHTGIAKAFSPVAERFSMQVWVYDFNVKSRLCIMVSMMASRP